MARSGQRQSGQSRRSTSASPGTRPRSRPRGVDNSGIIPILARRVREVEAKAQTGKVGPTNRTKFLVIALLMREERKRVKSDTELSDSQRAEEMKRLDGIATILAKTAARDTSLIALLESEAGITAAAQKLRRDWLLEAGAELSPDELLIVTEPEPKPEVPVNQVVPPSVRARQLANPFLPPDFSIASAPTPARRRLDDWELLGPLFKAFEYGAGGRAASMELPEPPKIDRVTPRGRDLMPHQARFIEGAREGHRSFLLADEPGLGKTAQSLLAASVTGSYPLLAVVPNVVKMNWAREVERWTPQRRATVIHGDGGTLDAFADVVIVNYDILDRHIGWLGSLGFRGMVVDEAHFIKNLRSQRSQSVLALAAKIRETTPGHDPLMIALTGTPLINDVDDFRAIWRFLGWIDETKPGPELMSLLEDTGLTPADTGFYPEAREAVIDLGIVRRKKIDVAADLPSKRIVDLPVELDDDLGRSIQKAERELGARMLQRYKAVTASITHELDDDERERFVRIVAQSELEESKSAKTGENVFTMVRRIGQAKAALAADYASQLARSVGKVVFFAKHIDVMDQAEETFEKRDLTSVSIRGDQTATFRQAQIDAFNEDPDVSVAVCSLTAAGVGVNLQASSNVVLAELSWTSAEQTQAIDRVHRIGQEEPVTAWRIIAAHTIDAKIAELIDAKAGLAARALDGADAEVASADTVQLDALMHVLREAIG
ncbi:MULTISPECIES: DEAD/DEAH box helicase [unclassified Rathayibacter]|uniref:DEAD/DEAH box helicase n=1 Tax=unclassified Rathayibacter TaxID=2609250 RepID=UPI000F4B015B|nr:MULTISPECIES: DEAD/DEAH box helicase [unclassified Rathayibacter]ROP57804.1 SNF2 family DNA or RNA helicase [Rathayibacter sp. PhB186]ROS56189.1 SNF2 family DNA or RNA helicase [Rathayibacter sp. PhB185]TCL84345.1 SNF2 family DNA or RNA helicase [Rathayibacter sp. PhB192]TCM30063.1 SNF2 family DNA or RNA helicase [Rathayibacter sp. PhB179]